MTFENSSEGLSNTSDVGKDREALTIRWVSPTEEHAEADNNSCPLPAQYNILLNKH